MVQRLQLLVSEFETRTRHWFCQEIWKMGNMKPAPDPYFEWQYPIKIGHRTHIFSTISGVLFGTKVWIFLKNKIECLQYTINFWFFNLFNAKK
mgnify:CR=1 FL=1